MYKLTSANSVIRKTDGASIPFDPANTDYQAFLKWKEEGNTPEPADLPDPAIQAMAKIVQIEANQHRAIREAVLYGDKTRLQKIDDDIKAERAKLPK